MIIEKDFEDIICKYPDLIEEGLAFKGRQITLYGRRMDILFEDKFRRKLIIELKVGPIKDEHIGQIMSYEGILLSSDDPSIRVMLVGNRVPPNIRRSLDHHGIAWKEITLGQLRKYLIEKNDNEHVSAISEQDEVLYKEKQPKDRRVRYPKSESEIGIDWKKPESHLSRIGNQNTLERINYIRNKIKEIDKGIAEGGREGWMTYRINGRRFVSIGCVAKNGNFTIAINLPTSEVKLEGYKSKDWGTADTSFITFEPTVDYGNIDQLLGYVNIAYKKAHSGLVLSNENTLQGDTRIKENHQKSNLIGNDIMENAKQINTKTAFLYSTQHDPDFIDKFIEHLKSHKQVGWSVGFKVNRNHFEFPVMGYLYLTRRGVKYKLVIDDIRPFNPNLYLSSDYEDIVLEEYWQNRETNNEDNRWQMDIIISRVEELPNYIDITRFKKLDGSYVKHAPQNYARVIDNIF